MFSEGIGGPICGPRCPNQIKTDVGQLSAIINNDDDKRICATLCTNGLGKRDNPFPSVIKELNFHCSLTI